MIYTLFNVIFCNTVVVLYLYYRFFSHSIFRGGMPPLPLQRKHPWAKQSMFHEKSNILNKKLRKSHCCQRLQLVWIKNDDKNQMEPLQSLHSPKPVYLILMFWWCCWMLVNHVILHMHLQYLHMWSLVSASTIKVITLSPKFSYSSSFPIKMLATDAKAQKIEPDLIFFYDRRTFWRKCVKAIDTTWGRMYFFTW